jgi:transposase
VTHLWYIFPNIFQEENMPRRRTMTDYRDVIRRLKRLQSIRSINRETGVHRKIIRKIQKVAYKKGWLGPVSHLPTEETLYKIFTKKKTVEPHPLDEFRDDIERYIGEEYSYVVIHQLIQTRYVCSEATVRRYIKRNFPKAQKVTMLRKTIPGEVMEVDFGFLGITYDPVTDRRRKTYIFSGRLRHSRDAYREIVFNQKQDTFFDCHIHAFEYFGGVPEKVVPDNLKAAVIKASFECPLINRVYQKLAEHYGFLISPCLPRKANHKGGVENDIKYVKKNFWPLFKEDQRAKGYTDLNAGELKSNLSRWNSEVARVRTVWGVGRSPEEIFESEEKAALKPLPLSRWDRFEWNDNVTVQQQWRIRFDNAFYTVPYKYIGQKVTVLANSKSVYIFLCYKLIALHCRARRRWEIVEKKEHAPPNVEAFMSTTRESIKRWARSIGPSVGRVVEEILAHKSVDGLRPARGLIGLKKKYGETRLEAACRRALAYDTPEYISVKSILMKELDKLDIDCPVDSEGQNLFKFARKYGYFNPENHIKKGDGKWMN